MDFLRLFLIRHGQVEANRRLALVGRQDPGLTPEGQRQADLLATLLAELSLESVYSSPLRRCVETARPLAASHGLEPRPTEALREQFFGEWEGLSMDQIAALGGDTVTHLERWRRDPGIAPPGGESLNDVVLRVSAWLEDLAADTVGQVALVTHVGPIKGLICRVLDAPLGTVSRFFLDPGTVTVVDWRRRPVLRLFNARQALTDSTFPH